MSRPLEQYLRRHAEPEASIIRSPRTFRQVAVVPAMGEDRLLRGAVASILASGGNDIGLILVLNARASDAPSVHEANDSAREWLASLDPAQVIVIDRAATGRWLPEKQGVGLARKIGNDVALAFRAAGAVEEPMLLQTDADAIVPTDWFARAAGHRPRSGSPVALTFPFRHTPVPPVSAVTIALYEIRLRSHRLALAWAGSPYAFQAIGSTLALDADALVLVRGIPRTMAGEDFYLLDKLVKTGPIHRLAGAPIRLAARESDRVPFGTGRAMLEMVRQGRTADDYRLPDPRGYRALRAWLETLEIAADPAPGWPGPATDVKSRLLDAELPATNVRSILEQMGAIRFVADSVGMNISAAVRRRRLHTWFNAFRTLRFLHALRDALWPHQPWLDALRGAPWLAVPEGADVSATPSPASPSSSAPWLSTLQQLDEREMFR